MTKAVAGVVPLLVLGVYWVLLKPAERPSWRKLVPVCAATAAVVLPWHLYQLAANPRWFVAEYIGVEILGYTIGAPLQTSAENQVLFYIRRMVLTDPLLCLAALAALPGLIKAARDRQAGTPLLLLVWIAVGFGVALLNQYRNLAYLLPVIPALCLTAALYGPAAGRRRQWALAAGLSVVFMARVAFPGEHWGLAFQPKARIPAAAVLEEYCGWGRGTELIIVSPDDQFYSAVLPLYHVRYAFEEGEESRRRPPLDFRHLGILVSAEEFIELERWLPVYQERLRTWGVKTDKPVATVVGFRSAEDIGRVIQAHPGSDYLVPERILRQVEAGVRTTHQVKRAAPGGCLLLADRRGEEGGQAVPLACRL